MIDITSKSKYLKELEKIVSYKIKKIKSFKLNKKLDYFNNYKHQCFFKRPC